MSDIKLDFKHTLTTDGMGLWSDAAKEVKVQYLECSIDGEDAEYGKHGELRVYFDTDSWDTATDGLIYTDEQFMDELRGYLEVNELDDSDIYYSEQGMQGDDYVSLDVGEKFITSWKFKKWAASELAGK